jgi:Cu-Zn family superoxide dismutase
MKTHRTSIKIIGSLGIAAVLALGVGCERRDKDGLPEGAPPPEKPMTPRISPAQPATVPDEGLRNADERVEDPANTGAGDPVVSNPYAASAELSEEERMNTSGTDTTGTGTAKNEQREAEADFKVAKGYELSGDAEFDEVANGVKIVVEVESGPVGKRGIHIHQKGDCSDIPGKSMGEHFSPQAGAHALPPNAKRHLGDLGNIQIGKDGKGRLEITVPKANLKENDPMSLLGRALVIHEAEDKGTLPSAGKPMACAVIEKS